jgi:hypothetical protein
MRTKEPTGYSPTCPVAIVDLYSAKENYSTVENHRSRLGQLAGERDICRQLLVRFLKLELRFVRLKEIAESFSRIQQAHPLLVVERYGKTGRDRKD